MVLQSLMIITGYDSFYPVIQKCCGFLDIEPIIFQWEAASSEFIVRLKETIASRGKPDVIISRGALADMVENSFPDIITIRDEPDDIDILEALESAMVFGRRIGLLIYSGSDRNYKIDVLRKILNLEELRFYFFHSAADIENQIAEGKRNGMDAMVGGGTLGVRTGKMVGIPVCFAETSARSLERAILQALTIINAHKRERIQIETFRSATSMISEGVLVLEDGVIMLANQEILHMLAAKEEQLCGCLMEQLTPEFFGKELTAFLMNDPRSEKVLTIREHDYLVKKRMTTIGSQKRLTAVFHSTDDIQRQEQQVRIALRNKGFMAHYRFCDIIGNSPAMQEVRKKASLYAATDANILISGENGTGKEMFAQSIHNSSIRKDSPFVAVNCAAIPESLLESELFGYEEGSFSGARRGGRPGLFELAQSGTLFLDEINSLPLHVQGVLLRAIQEKEIRRIGSGKVLSVDIRIISATNAHMDQLIAEGKFRPDLYYRLNVLGLRIPSLTERKEDILPMACKFLMQYAKQYHVEPPQLSKEDETCLLNHPWAGNVRALENVIQRFVILRGGMDISVDQCMEENMMPPASGRIEISPGTLEEMEEELIRLFVDRNNGNRGETAKQLGISRTTLWKKLDSPG